MRVIDATLIGLALISLIFVGMVFLIVDIPIFNSINPVSIEIADLGMFLGLAFGLLAGNWYTKQQLSILSEKIEFRGLGSKRLYYALFSGLAIFLIYSFFVIFYNKIAFAEGLITFVISATFALYVIRLIVVYSWEKRVRKIMMMEWNKFYSIPK
jgi:hypothetical protein